MKSIKDNKLLNDLCQEYNIELPKNLQNRKIYEEIANFKDAEYIYCIAYEMLIRTDEYNDLLKEYEPLKNISKDEMTTEEFSKLRVLIDKMNTLGLKKTSFLGFDCDDDYDHVFKRIEYYNEVQESPWNVRMLHKLQLDSDENIYYLLANFYFEKDELYALIDDTYMPMPDNLRNFPINVIKKESQWKTEKECEKFYNTLGKYYIPCIEKETKKTKYKSLTSNSIYLNELDKDFLSQLKEKQDRDLLIKTKSDISYYNTQFWDNYNINDIKNGLNKLIEFHLNNNYIYDQNCKHTKLSKNDILKDYSNFYIPCVNQLIKPEVTPWNKKTDPIHDENFIQDIESLEGIKVIVRDKGYITLNKKENIYLIQINKNIPLALLENSFLTTLKYEDLKNIYIETDPIFSRPRLMFDEARLTNIPINLNLSKEDLLLYISQIKDDYNRDKNIVKTDEEYFFDLTLESDLAQLPTNMKYEHEKRNPKNRRFLPVNRYDFIKRFASAFYIYDLFKEFIPLFDKKRNDLRQERDAKIQRIKSIAKRENTNINQVAINEVKEYTKQEIKNYENNNLFTQISYLVNDFSEEQIKYYLTTMKELIHGVNMKGENNVFKKKYVPNKEENPEPKYKNLIIGNSYIVKNNKTDLIKSLID